MSRIFRNCILMAGMAFSFSSFTVALAASPPTSILEQVEWTWAAQPNAPNPALPNVLLVGDSITRGYYPEVAKLFAGRANCYLFATSAASGDPRLLAQLSDYFVMVPLKFEVIHFNNGMHGWKYSEAAYAEALPALVQELVAKGRGAKLVWATTTPVRTREPNGATNERIDDRNLRAMSTMKRFHITDDDQHALMLAHSDLHSDNVHYTDAGSKLQAQQVAQTISKVMSK